MITDEDNLDRERAPETSTLKSMCFTHGPFIGTKCPACSASEAFNKAAATKGNATFHAFRQSGKWYTTERGNFTESVLATFERDERRAQILADNNGKFPGLNGRGDDLVFVVIPDDNVPFGYPLMLLP